MNSTHPIQMDNSLFSADFFYGPVCTAVYGSGNLLQTYSFNLLSQYPNSPVGYYTLLASRFIKLFDWAGCRPLSYEGELSSIYSEKMFYLFLGDPKEAITDGVQLTLALTHRFGAQFLQKRIHDYQVQLEKHQDDLKDISGPIEKQLGKIPDIDPELTKWRNVRAQTEAKQRKIARGNAEQHEKRVSLLSQMEEQTAPLTKAIETLTRSKDVHERLNSITSVVWKSIFYLLEAHKWLYTQPEIREREYKEYTSRECPRAANTLGLNYTGEYEPDKTAEDLINKTITMHQSKEIVSEQERYYQKVMFLICTNFEKFNDQVIDPTDFEGLILAAADVSKIAGHKMKAEQELIQRWTHLAIQYSQHCLINLKRYPSFESYYKKLDNLSNTQFSKPNKMTKIDHVDIFNFLGLIANSTFHLDLQKKTLKLQDYAKRFSPIDKMVQECRDKTKADLTKLN